MSAHTIDEMQVQARNPVYRRRLVAHKFGMMLCVLAMAIGIAFLAWILFVLLIKGVGSLSLDMFTQTTPAPGSDGGGLINPIVGSLMMVGVATIIRDRKSVV